MGWDFLRHFIITIIIIIHLLLLSPLNGIAGGGAYPSGPWVRPGPPRTNLLIITGLSLTPVDQLERPVQPRCTCLDGVRNLEYLERKAPPGNPAQDLQAVR